MEGVFFIKRICPFLKSNAMRKKIVTGLLLACGLVSVGVQAQQYQRYSVPQRVVSEKAAEGVVLGYCSDRTVGAIGFNQEVESAAAIRIPADLLAPYVGGKVATIRFAHASAATKASVFLTRDLTGKPLYTKEVGKANEGWNDIAVDYTLEAGDLYVGYISTGTNQVSISDKYSDDGVYLRETETKWANYATSQKWGALHIQLVVNGETIPANVLSFEEAEERYFGKVGEPVIVSATVKNMGGKELNNYDVAYRLGDQEEQVVSINDLSVPVNGMNTFTLELPAKAEQGVLPLTLSLKSVNGGENKAVWNVEKKSEVEYKTYLFPRKVVVEEGTGTWCPFCVRGIVGMHEMQKRYPDTFIGIAAHSGDPMESSSYRSLFNKFEGFPSCIVNRNSNMVIDPNTEELDAAYRSVNKKPADIGVEVKAAFATADENSINIVTSTTFGFSSDAVAYRLAFVLMEDSVHSDLSGYAQKNGYAGSSEPMGGFENLPNLVPANQMYYENVARGIYKSFSGTLNSVPYVVTEGETYSYTYQIDERAYRNAKVLDKMQLYIAALLIDTKSGEIVNADKVAVESFATSGIDNTPAADCKVYVADGCIKAEGDYDLLRVFTVDGIEVPNQQLGGGIYLVQIVKGNHIAVKKLAVK